MSILGRAGEADVETRAAAFLVASFPDHNSLPGPMSLILTPLATPRQLRHTPSSQDGIPADLEADLRAFGAQLIQEAGTLAQL